MNNTVLICPRNDEESLMILKIAKKMKISVVVSGQAHGARLEKENRLVERIKEVSPDAKTLVIVEIPGITMEQELKDLGYEIVIIDHHRYEDFDRMKKESSLEQFLQYFDINNQKLIETGFEPTMVLAVGVIDRGFLWELKNTALSENERKQARVFYRSLTLELNPERREREESAAKEVWKGREEKDGILIFHGPQDISVRDSLSFIIADNYEEPPVSFIIQGERRMYVQDTQKAKILFDTFGGFTFSRDTCWGILVEGGDSLPGIESVMQILTTEV